MKVRVFDLVCWSLRGLLGKRGQAVDRPLAAPRNELLSMNVETGLFGGMSKRFGRDAAGSPLVVVEQSTLFKSISPGLR